MYTGFEERTEQHWHKLNTSNKRRSLSGKKPLFKKKTRTASNFVPGVEISYANRVYYQLIPRTMWNLPFKKFSASFLYWWPPLPLWGYKLFRIWNNFAGPEIMLISLNLFLFRSACHQFVEADRRRFQIKLVSADVPLRSVFGPLLLLSPNL